MEKLKTIASSVASKVGVLGNWAVVMCVAYMALALAIGNTLKSSVPGPRGAQGVQGVQGPVGPAGKSAPRPVLTK
jgi:hypothetical protein